VKLGGTAGAVGETQLSDIQNQRIRSDLELYFEGDIDHGRFQALRLIDGSLDSNQKGVLCRESRMLALIHHRATVAASSAITSRIRGTAVK
jgi:hypothetical protein